MKVIYGIGKVKSAFKNAALAIGVFDGVHIGHQALIKKTIERAKEIKGQAVVMTFSPHPVHVLHPQAYQPLIISLHHRLRVFENLGVAACVVVHFTKRFSHLTPQNFIKRYLADRISPKEIFVGDDFRFGQNRSGTLDIFKEAGQKYGFKVNAITSIKGSKSKIGSTQIRKLIADGKLGMAKKYLGRPVAVMGTVVKGEARGNTLGYPTANLEPEESVIVPLGVFAVHVFIGEKMYKGMANVGRKPSFKSINGATHIEAHIFNFNKSIYGKQILVEFIKKIRDEKAFKSKEELIVQLKKDEQKVKTLFKK